MAPLRSWFTVLAVMLGTAGCPAPPPPQPVVKPSPPPEPAPVVEEEEPPPPVPPGVVYFRRARAGTELVHVDSEGLERRVLHTLGGSQRESVAVEGTRYVVVTECKTIDGAQAPAHKPGVTSILVGDLADGTSSSFRGDARCRAHSCFEGSPLLSADGATLVTRLMRSAGTRLARYDLAAPADPEVIGGEAMRHPTLSPDLRRLAWAGKRSVHVVDVAGGPRFDVGVRGLRDQPILLTDEHVIYELDDGGPQLQWSELGSGTQQTIHRLASAMRADAPRYWRPEEKELVTVEQRGDVLSVIAVPVDRRSVRTIAAGVVELLDLTSDGRWLLVRVDEADEPTLVVYDLVRGEAVQTLRFPDESTPTGARLAR